MAKTPTLRQLTYFLAVADTLSFVRAAERCNVTQPTLSGGLRELEAILGGALFERTSRDVAITRLGENLIAPTQDVVRKAEDLVQIAANANREPLSGTLRLGVIPTIAPYLLPRLLPAFGQSYPHMELQLKEDLTAHLLSALEKRTLDVALIAFPYDTPGMEQIVLWAEPFLIAKPGHIASDTRHATFDDLKNMDLMLLEDGHCLRDQALAACRLQPSAQRKTFGAASLITLTQMVQHGFGATLLPAMAIDPNNAPRGVTIQRFAEPQPSRSIGLAWRRGNPRESEFRLLGKTIKASK